MGRFRKALLQSGGQTPIQSDRNDDQGRYFDWKLTAGTLEFSERQTHFEREKKIEGKYVTATSEKGLSVLDAVAM